jgi:hypothetical protein
VSRIARSEHQFRIGSGLASWPQVHPGIWVGGTQSLTTTTNYVLHHLGHSKLVKKGKVREEDVKQA